MSSLPGGTVTFVFTDIEGSTRLLQELGDEGYGQVSGDHRRLVRETFGAHGGTEIDTQGDAFFFSFPRARDAVAAAVDAQRALRDHAWPAGHEVRVRMGLHTGEPHVGEEGYLGLDVVRAARISAAGHGGQVLISETTRALLGNQLPEGVAVHDLGQQDLKDVQHEHIYELTIDGRSVSTRPLKTQKPQTPKSRQEDMAARFEERITAYVEKQLESAFDPEGGPPKVPTKLAFGGAAIGLGVLLMIAVAVVAIAVLIKVAFF
ncbi:MAG TPA: adenylate/guanylate cyclase domain-containing protein [Gaiellaceae bacterium]|nr:adenylate/guanylate cyclase domain-containing protein [Gaiellaceae bacterium]